MWRRVVTGLLVLAAVAAAILVGPDIHSDGDITEVDPLELGVQSPILAQTTGRIDQDEHGYRVLSGGRGTATVPFVLPDPGDGRTLLRIWAYAPDGVSTAVALQFAKGSERFLGRPKQWVGKSFDVTDEARGGSVRIVARSVNRTDEPVLFLDRIAPVAAPASARATASAWSVGLLVALLAAALLALAARFRTHWPLPLLLGGAAALLWADVPSLSLEPLSPDVAPTWNAVRDASWFGFHDGLFWGSWELLSSLTVQFFHALTPFVGTAPVSARSAGIFVGLLALAAVYALGNRAAGRLGAVVATCLALASDAFRDAAVAGTSLPVLILAAALFGYALHACLAEASIPAILLLAGGVALLAIAEPTWLPGGLGALVLVALAYAPEGQRLRGLGAGLLAVAILLIPHWASTADQHEGSMFADMSARATYARNVEFLDGGHGAPTAVEFSRDPISGRPVTLSGYLLRDHSVSQATGGVLAGGHQAFSAIARRDASGILGLLAFVVLLLGAVYVLILPRLRALVLLPPLIAAPTLFFADREAMSAFAAAAPMWPALFAVGGILAYAVVKLARPYVQEWVPARARAGFRRLRIFTPARGRSGSARIAILLARRRSRRSGS